MIGILCSAVGFGHYVPGLLIQRELASLGIDSTVLVFERFLSDEQRQALVTTRAAYQRNATLVSIGRKVALKTRPQTAVGMSALLEHVDLARVRRFVVISGFWIPLLTELARRQRVSADVLHVDSVCSPSWDVVREGIEELDARRFWFSNHAAGRMEHRVDAGCTIVPFGRRANAVLAHGGGWAVGAYKGAASRVADAGFAVEVILPATESAPSWAAAVYRPDPQWEAWSTNGREPAFPPLLRGDAPLPQRDGAVYHDALEVGRHVLAVVSKPGGATILDCLEAATPLVYAQPEGEHEARNAELWRGLGLAIPLDEWAATGFAREPLEQMHERLLHARSVLPTYVRARLTIDS